MPATLGWCNLAAMLGSRHELWIVAVFATSLIACAAPEPESEVGGGGWSATSSGDERKQAGGVAAAPRSGAENASDSELVLTGSRISKSRFSDGDQAQDDSASEPAPMRSATARARGGYVSNDELYAQAPQPSQSSAPPAPAEPATDREVVSDGRSGPLLIYEARIGMAVYKVEEIQRQAIAIATELGGFLAEQADQQAVVLRVPAARFDAALARIEALGQVFERYVKAEDVSDQFRDLSLRLRNAEAMRDRLIQLLAKANDVKSSLEVEHELDRLLERIEMLKGQLKSLGDRIAYSTITVQFRAKREETLNPEFRLPFLWLERIGLQHLLRFDE